jgi:hypothetical protein
MVVPLASAAVSVLSGFSFVPAAPSSPVGDTNTPQVSATTDGSTAGSQLAGGAPSPPSPASAPPLPELVAELELVVVLDADPELELDAPVPAATQSRFSGHSS